MQVAVSALSSNFGLIGFTVLEIEQYSYFDILAWNCLFTPTFRFFWGIFSPNDVIHCCNPQKAVPCAETRRLSHKVWKSVQRFDLGAGSRKKGQDRTVKKWQRRYISPIWGEAPAEAIFTKIGTVVAVPNIITCANVWAEIFRGYGFTGGRISRFPIDSFMSLTTVQRYCDVCDGLAEGKLAFILTRYTANCTFVNASTFHVAYFAKCKLRFPGRQISWVSDWLIEWLITRFFSMRLARQSRLWKKRNLAQR